VIKSQLALNLAGQLLHLPRRVAEKAVDVVLDEIITAMARKDGVELRRFGAFSVKDRAGRIGRNPRSGVKVQVPEKSVSVFRAEQRNRQTAQPRRFDTRIIRMDDHSSPDKGLRLCAEKSPTRRF
jgi:integration host factor subunit beta